LLTEFQQKEIKKEIDGPGFFSGLNCFAGKPKGSLIFKFAQENRKGFKAPGRNSIKKFSTEERIC